MSAHAPGARPPRVGLRLAARFAVAGLVIAVMAGVATATGVLLNVKDVADAINSGGRALLLPSGTVTRAQAGDPQTLLIIGSDRRWRTRKDKHNARSDTLMLIRLDPDSPATTMMSIPRDLKVYLNGPSGAPDKINAAYSIGGPAMTARVVKRLLSWPGHPFVINHIVNVNFGGFKAAVNTLGCVFADVDRNYFNDNNPPAGGGPPYATIDIKPGYQRLCGQKALDYVRFRHLDTDIVRSARQQDFLRQVKQQYGTAKFFSNRGRLARIFGRYTQTDHELHSTTGILKLLDLVVFSGRKPLQEVHFPAQLGAPDDPFVTADPAAVHAAVERFLHPKVAARKPATAPKRPARHKHHASPFAVPGMVAAVTSGEQQATLVAAKVRFPIYYPKLITSAGRYMGPLGTVYPRAYHITAGGRRYGAYRLVMDAGGIGQYYGVQGTTWRDPPLLRSPSEIRTVAGRRLLLFYDGSHLRFVGWRTSKAAYWVSNTLSEDVGNRQMLAMAASLQRVGSSR